MYQIVTSRWYHIDGLIRLALVIVVATMGITCVDEKMREQVKNYRGDGQIAFVKGPLLGIDGCSIKMAELDLSRTNTVEYNLSGIPKGGPYRVYLSVPDTAELQRDRLGSLRLIIQKDGTVVSESSAMVSEMVNNIEGKLNRFYFEDGGLFEVNERDSTWSLIVEHRNTESKGPSKGYIEISKGGFK